MRNLFIKLSFIALSLITTKAESQSQNEEKPKEFITILGSKPVYPFIDTTPQNSFSLVFLKENNINHSEELWSLVPNMNVAGGSNRVRHVQIRGIGERSQYENTPDSSVGVFLDHIDLSNSLNLVNTNNLQSVNIYYGPQAFIYGSDALAGNIILKSVSPSLIDKKVNLTSILSDFNKKGLNLRYSTPLSNNFSINTALNLLRSDGFIENTFLNEYTNKQKELSLNLNTSYTTSNFELKTSHIFASQKNGYDVWNFTPHTYKTVSDKPGSDNQTTSGHSIEANIKLSKTSTMSFISSLSLNDIFYSYDEDWGNNPYWNSIPGYNADYDYNKSYNRENSKFHQKLIYQKDFKSKLKLTSGVHYSQTQEESEILSFNNNSLRDSLISNFKNEQVSSLLGFTKKFQKLSFSLNSRFQRTFLNYKTDSPFAKDFNESHVGFNSKIKYKFNEFKNINFIFSKGFKNGGFNPDTNLDNQRQVFLSENLYNYEINYTYSPLDLKLSLFFMDRRDQQVTTSFQDDPMDPSSFSLYIDNAAKSSNYGLELSTRIIDYIFLRSNINIGLLKADFINYQREGVIFDNREQAHSPSYTFSILNSFKINKKLDLVLNIYGKDSFYFSNGHNEVSKAYQVVDLNLNYTLNKRLRLSLWSKNLFDKDYAQRGFYFANEPPLWQDKLYIQSGPPRETGVSLSYDFN